MKVSQTSRSGVDVIGIPGVCFYGAFTSSTAQRWALSLLARRRAYVVLGQSFHLNSLGPCSHLTHKHRLPTHNVTVLFHDYLMRNKIKLLHTVESTVQLKGQLLIIYIFKKRESCTLRGSKCHKVCQYNCHSLFLQYDFPKKRAFRAEHKADEKDS